LKERHLVKMKTNPNSKAETVSDESQEEFLERVVLRTNKRGKGEVTRFQVFEEDVGRGWLAFESHPDADTWELVYHRDDPEHVPVTVARFSTKKVFEMEFRMSTEDLPFDGEKNVFYLAGWDAQRMKLYVREIRPEEYYGHFVGPAKTPGWGANRRTSEQRKT